MLFASSVVNFPQSVGFLFALTLAAFATGLAGCDDDRGRLPASGAKVVGASSEVPVVAPATPRLDPLRPPCVGRMDTSLIRECSGFAASKKYPGVYWTLSDSGDGARIFAINALGETVPNVAGKKFAGIRVTGAKNVDWESLAVDGAGRLIIGDFGDNLSGRRDLCLYVLDTEPDPARAAGTVKARRVPLRYCDRVKVPEPAKNHDGEAMFCHRGAVYVFTKHWSDAASTLHRVDMTAGENEPKPTTLVARFESRGMVTDAAVSPDGRRLAVLTYTGVWVFALPANDAEHPLSGRALYRPLVFPLTSWQVEAIAFTDDETLLIGNEEGDLYRVRLSDLAPAQ